MACLFPWLLFNIKDVWQLGEEEWRRVGLMAFGR